MRKRVCVPDDHARVCPKYKRSGLERDFGLLIGLQYLANKNTGLLVKFEFQMKNE